MLSESWKTGDRLTAYGSNRQRPKLFGLTLGSRLELELCADVIVSAARRSISVGSAPSVQKNWRRRRGAAWAAKRVFFQDSRKNVVLSSKFSEELFKSSKL